MSGLSGKGYSRTLLLSVVMLGIIAVSVILVSALQASSQGARLVIELPPGHEILNTSPQNVSLYYAELWAVVPDGLLVVKKGFLNPLRPVIEVTPADLINATSKWLEIYAKKGKQVRPSILIQVSAYSEKENRMALAFGASVIYDPEGFVPGRAGNAFSHKILEKDFPKIKIREVGRSKEAGSSVWLYSRLVVSDLIFDSNDPRLPGLLRGKIPLLVAHLDPRSAATGVGFAYKVENVPGIALGISVIDVYEKRSAFGGSSLLISSITGAMGSAIVIDHKGRYGLIYLPGIYKVYEARELICRDLWESDGDHYARCESVQADQSRYVLAIVTYVEPLNKVGGIDDVSPENISVDIDTIRRYIGFSYQGSVGPGFITISRDPQEIWTIPLEIVILTMLKSSNVASSIADVAGLITIPTIIFRSSNTVVEIDIFSREGASQVYIARATAYYKGGIINYRTPIIDIR